MCSRILLVVVLLTPIAYFTAGLGSIEALAAPKSSNPLSGDEAAIRDGKSLFRGICAVCHGRNADGKGERGQGADLRKFKRGFTRYLEITQNGKDTGRTQKMPAWGKVLPEEDLIKIGAFLETLAIEGANWVDPE